MRQTEKTTIFHFIVGWGLFFLSYSLLIAVNGSLHTLSIPCLSLAYPLLKGCGTHTVFWLPSCRFSRICIGTCVEDNRYITDT